MARQPLPSRAEYLHRLTRALVLVREAYSAVEDVRDLPQQGFLALWSRDGRQSACYRELLPDLLRTLDGTAYTLMVAEERMGMDLPPIVDMLVRGVVVDVAASPPNRNSHLIGVHS